jgi:hypothetical protein
MRNASLDAIFLELIFESEFHVTGFASLGRQSGTGKSARRLGFARCARVTNPAYASAKPLTFSLTGLLLA